MNEFELYTRILAPKYQSAHQGYLIEDKLQEPQKVQKADIIDTSVKCHVVYRLDMDEENFLPFFNNTHSNAEQSVEYPTPKFLLAFCDYIILAVVGIKLYVVLVEMKSGDHSKAHLQLQASETFMNFVKQTALRIKAHNEYNEFDEKNIILRKVILKPALKARPTTNIAKGGRQCYSSDLIVYEGNVLPLARICKKKQALHIGF